MPSKALCGGESSPPRRGACPGVATGPLDADAVLARRDEVVHDLDNSSQLPWLEARGVVLVRGHGRLDGERLVRVGEDVLHAQACRGASQRSSATIRRCRASRRRSVDEHRGDDGEARPRRLFVLGGGVVGVEMAQAWSSLGSHVTSCTAAIG